MNVRAKDIGLSLQNADYSNLDLLEFVCNQCGLTFAGSTSLKYINNLRRLQIQQRPLWLSIQQSWLPI